jgi:hypothetical protein|nr:hypothetical protein [Aeromicrobium sp.]
MLVTVKIMKEFALAAAAIWGGSGILVILMFTIGDVMYRRETVDTPRRASSGPSAAGTQHSSDAA